MKIFSIGDFEFLDMTRAISRPTKRISREVRSGVAGVTWWNTGRRGEPFSLITTVDVADVPGAIALLKQYEQLKDLMQLQPLRWASDPLNGCRAMVLEVQPIERGLHHTIAGFGGKLGSSNALLRCQWDLEAVEMY